MSCPVDDPLQLAAQAALRCSGMGRYVGPALRPATVLTFGLILGALVPVDVITHGPSFCPFKVLTGLPCPGCGMTRSVVTLLHGDLGMSVYYHPLGIALVAVMVALAVIDGWTWWHEAQAGPARSSPAWLMNRVMLTPAPWVAIGMLTLVWFVRLPLYAAGIWVF
jgi:hypothetical protein